MFWYKKVLLAKMETVYGTDPTPTAAANAIQAFNIDLNPLQGDEIKREVLRATRGGYAAILGSKFATLSFDVELSGSGAAGTAPAYGPLLRMCGLSEVITAGTRVEYQPVSASYESGTLYMYLDGVLHQLRGARGNAEFDLTIKKLPMVKFNFTGLFVPVSDSALPTNADFAAFAPPVTVSNTNSDFALHGFTTNMQSLAINLGQEVVHRELTGIEEVVITGGATSGSAVVEAVSVATQDYFGAVSSEAQGAMAMVHGLVAGNIVKIDAPAVQLLSPSYSESDRFVMFNTNLNILPTVGNDDLKLTLE